MKRSELVRQLNLLPDVEVGYLHPIPDDDEHLGDIGADYGIKSIYLSNSNKIIIDGGYDIENIPTEHQPKSNKFE